MNVLNNFLTSGHQFSEDENLLKFRFSLLNSMMTIALILDFINFFASFFGAIDFGRTFENAVLIHGIVSIFIVYSLRKNKSYYFYVANFFLITSLVLFYFVVLTRKEDEFRLVAFFLALVFAYVLLGKKYGACLGLFIMASILLISLNYDLGVSSFAYSTFYSFFIALTLFLYFFLNKIEADALEFKVLNNKLKENVKKEIEQRQAQEIMLLRQSRKANMGEMLDSIAHQWRQPLMHINSILMNMDNAIDTNSAKKKDENYMANKIDEVATLTSHMSQTIEDFRGLFEVEKEQTYFTLESVINDVLTLMKNSFNDIEIYYKTKDDTLILAYRSELIQVIIILLSNAVEVLDARNIQNKLIIIESTTLTDIVVFSVEDNAGGIATENLESIFDPYFTTKKESGGTGLGLYLAKIIVEQKMSGQIIASNTASGAKFTITLS